MAKYNITAKATEHDGIVFRSRLEAQCWEYFKLFFEGIENQVWMEYEPPLKGCKWNPDFSICECREDIEWCTLVEVKSSQELFNLPEYLQAFDVYQNNDRHKLSDLVLLSPDGVVFIGGGGFSRGIDFRPIKEDLWKQAWNNVKASVNGE